jgi:glycosyltransferase involved in cell wall biosynthesis
MISIITPAHNDELFIEKCLCSVNAAAKQVSEAVEHIVVLNVALTELEKLPLNRVQGL